MIWAELFEIVEEIDERVAGIAADMGTWLQDAGLQEDTWNNTPARLKGILQLDWEGSSPEWIRMIDWKDGAGIQGVSIPGRYLEMEPGAIEADYRAHLANKTVQNSS